VNLSVLRVYETDATDAQGNPQYKVEFNLATATKPVDASKEG
jgi:hypothetical protein